MTRNEKCPSVIGMPGPSRWSQMLWPNRAPVLSGPKNRQAFEIYVATQLAPTHSKGDLGIMDKSLSHQASRVTQIIQDYGIWPLFPPPCFPDLNPKERELARLKKDLQKCCSRTTDASRQVGGHIYDLFKSIECWNCFPSRRIHSQLNMKI